MRAPTGELKVHAFLNVGHQRGCKVVTSGTSVPPEFVVAGDVKRSAVALLPLVEIGTAPPIVPEYDMLRPMNRFSHHHV